MPNDWRRDDYLISTDPERLDYDMLHGFLTRAYWSTGIPRELITRMIDHSLPFGLYQGTRQIGFARAITDRATFAYLADVFVLEEFRGRGLAAWLMEVIVGHPDLQGLRRWVLLTRDAHGLYRRFGFTDLAQPDRYMERWDPEVYRRLPGAAS